ncbi:hypothetical protein B0T22DRAFT_521204, partial [Podospora appendiculata]
SHTVVPPQRLLLLLSSPDYLSIFVSFRIRNQRDTGLSPPNTQSIKSLDLCIFQPVYTCGSPTRLDTMSTHNPSEGQKVTTSKNAPFTSEGAGEVSAQSLAADSIRSGGAFASNRGAMPGSGATADAHARTPGTADSAYAGVETQQSYGGAAPSYVNAQAASPAGSGPKGMSLTEGGFAGSGTDGGALPEPGSKRDPARLAEQHMGLGGQNREPGVEGGGRLGKGEGEQPFAALERDEAL